MKAGEKAGRKRRGEKRNQEKKEAKEGEFAELQKVAALGVFVVDQKPARPYSTGKLTTNSNTRNQRRCTRAVFFSSIWLRDGACSNIEENQERMLTAAPAFARNSSPCESSS
eukprot:3191622-Rhodomonas_salina.1